MPYVLNDDNYYHETKVAGIIGAEINNGEGIIGVAPGCKILPIKFYKNATAVSEPDFSEKLAAAFNYIAALKNQFPDKKFVINFSYGFDNAELDEQIVSLAITNCVSNNIPVFASAGNITGKPVKYPANLSETICVTGVIGTNFNRVGPFNIGSEVDFAAPYKAENTTSINDGYDSFSGSSAATPLATGVAALLLSIDNSLSVNDIRTILRNTAEKVDPENANYDVNGFSVKLGYGRIDAYAATGYLNDIVFENDVEGQNNIGEISVNGEILSSG